MAVPYICGFTALDSGIPATTSASIATSAVIAKIPVVFDFINNVILKITNWVKIPNG